MPLTSSPDRCMGLLLSQAFVPVSTRHHSLQLPALPMMMMHLFCCCCCCFSRYHRRRCCRTALTLQKPDTQALVSSYALSSWSQNQNQKNLTLNQLHLDPTVSLVIITNKVTKRQQFQAKRFCVATLRFCSRKANSLAPFSFASRSSSLAFALDLGFFFFKRLTD